MNYLALVNAVLVKLREPTVSTVQENLYSKLIGALVNDYKHKVEVAYDWNCLYNTVTVATSADLYSYALTDVGHNFRVLDVFNDSTDAEMRFAPVRWMTQMFNLTPVATGEPFYWAFNGQDDNGDPLLDIYPVPDGAYNVRLNLVQHQAALSNDLDILKVPYEPVVQGAYAAALIERGEDGGQNSSEAFALYLSMLADAVALEEQRYAGRTDWEPV